MAAESKRQKSLFEGFGLNRIDEREHEPKQKRGPHTHKFSPTRASEIVMNTMRLAMTEGSEEIYRFGGQIYRPDGEHKIDQTLCGAAGDNVTSDKLRETLRRIKNTLLDNPVVFDPNPYLLGVKNGVVDLLTGKIREYCPEDLITDQIQVYYNASAKCPAFLAFLESITPNISDRITLIDWFAATAIKVPFAYVLFLLGLGRNGKGIYEKLIKKFFGQTAFRDMPLQAIEKSDFAASEFYLKRGWIASETGKKNTSIGTDFIKLTSGNGVIDGNRKGKSRIQFEPFFQTIVDTNTMPQIEDSSIGWMERFVKVDLPYVFVANPDKNNPLEKQRDPGLFEKLTTESELSGILNLLLFRSQAIGKSGQIHKRMGGKMFAEYAEQSSSVATFLDRFCEYNSELSGLWTPFEQIYEAYRTWCCFKVGEVIDIRHFGRQLKKFCGGFNSKRGKDMARKNTTLYKGLIFYENKYQSELEALKLSISQDGSVMSQSNINEKEETISQHISMSQLSQLELWNEILKRFGTPSEPKKEEDILSKKIDTNLTDLSETTETSKANESFCGEPIREISETSRDKSEIPTEIQKAKDAPSITCAKCGEDLTGHGQITKGGKVYCAKAGCGYPAR